MEDIVKFLPYVLMIGVFYFLMIRPQQKRAKSEREFESQLKIGDKIITKSGIHGRISELAEKTIVIETMSGKLKMERSSISMEMSSKMNEVVVLKK
jgi:preprotein translocase subunit YajC